MGGIVLVAIIGWLAYTVEQNGKLKQQLKEKEVSHE